MTPLISICPVGIKSCKSLLEPKKALNGGNDGLDVIKKVIYKAKYTLKINGTLALEIGNGQLKKVSKLLRNYLALDVSTNGGIGQLASVFLRGHNSNQTLVKVNGIKIKPVDVTAKLLFPIWKMNEEDRDFTVMKII